MQSTQDRLVTQIDRAITATVGDDGKLLALTVDSDYANTGTFGAIRSTDLVATNRMSYDFQSGRARFTPADASGRTRDDVFVYYSKGPDHAAEQIARVVEYLTRGIRREPNADRKSA